MAASPSSLSGSRIRLPNRWVPRDYQLPAWNYLENGGLKLYAVWHRRAGKDDVAMHWAAVAAHMRVGNYWHMLPQASQARKAVWDAVNPHTGTRRIDEAFPPEVRATTRENEMLIKFRNGSTWQVIGSDNYDSLVGSPPVGVVFSEWALAKPQSWAYLRPILAENKGWAAFITTPRGNNHAAKMFAELEHDKTAFVQKLPATETSVFTQDQLKAELKAYIVEHGQVQGTLLYEQEYLCSFDSAIFGSYFGHDLEQARKSGRITVVPYDSTKLVHTAWDLGKTDATAIWFYQQVAGETRIIDYFEDTGEDVPYYLAKMESKGYRYGTNWLPHDAKDDRIGMPMTIENQVRSNGYKVEIAPEISVRSGINAVHSLLAGCYFDETRCAAGLDALQNYRRDYNARLEEFKDTPVHDWASHGADAFRYLAVSLKQERIGKPKTQQIKRKGIV